MDYQRKPSGGRWLRRIAFILAFGVLIAGATVVVSRLQPAMPVVQRSSVMVGTIQHGSMVRQVRGPGSLVPVDVTWVTAQVGGQVVDVPVEPGIEVQPETVLLVLSEPQTERNFKEAERSLGSAKAELERFEVTLKQSALDLKATTAGMRATYDDAKIQAELDAELYRKGLISGRQKDLSEARAERNRVLLEIQLDRVKNNQTTQSIQLKEVQVAVARAQDLLQDRKRELDALTIRAGVSGILQQLGTSVASRFEPGQRVGSGSVIAKITDPERLKAVLQIMETQARDVLVGQKVSIDTHNGIVPGRVSRIDTAVQNGTVTVDVELVGDLPKGARPDLSVEGMIELERLEDVLYVARPSYGQADASLKLFKLVEDGTAAVRTLVKLGRSSVNTIEVLEGLEEGDQVILSDTPVADNVDRIRVQ